MSHKTLVSSSLTSLGSDPSKPSYLFMSVYKAVRVDGSEVLPKYTDILNQQRQGSGFLNLLSYAQWSLTNWIDYWAYTSNRKKSLFPIPLKLNGKYLGEGSIADNCKNYKIAYKKVFGQVPKRLIAGIKNQKNEGQYTYLSVVFGVPANTTNKYMLGVLFNTINNARLENVLELGFDAYSSYEQWYSCKLSNIPTYEIQDGVLTGYKKDDCKIVLENGTISIIRQHKNYWEKLSNFTLTGRRDVHAVRGKNITEDMDWIEESTKSATGMFVPVSFNDLQIEQDIRKTTALSNLAMMQITNVKIIHVPWYMESIFKVLLFIIIAVISAIVIVFTFGTATPAVVGSDTVIFAAIEGGLTVVLGTIVSTAFIAALAAVLADYLIATLVLEVLKIVLKPIIGKPLSKLIGSLVGMVAGNFVGFGNLISTNLLGLIQEGLSITSSVDNYITQQGLQDYQNKERNLQNWEYSQQQTIDNAYNSHGMSVLDKNSLNPILNDPATFYAFNQTDVLCQANVLTGYDIIDIQMSQIKDHYKNGTAINIGN